MLRHVKRIANVSLKTLRILGTSGRSESVFRGFVIGLTAWIFLRRFSNTFGFNHETNAALILAVGLSFFAGSLIGRRFPFVRESGLPAVIAACWLALLTTIAHGIVALLPTLPTGWHEGEISRLAVLMLAAVALVGVPSACGAMVLDRSRATRHEFSLALGLIGALFAATLLIGPLIGLTEVSYVIAIGIAVVWLAQQWRSGNVLIPESADCLAGGNWMNRAIGLTSLIAAGVGAGALTRALAQLVPSGPYLLAAGGAGLLLGVAIATTGRRFVPATGSGRLLGALCVTAGFLLPLALFESLLKLHMHVNVSVSSVPLLIALRAGMVCLGFLPLGVGVALLAGEKQHGRRLHLAPLVWFAFGLAATPWILPHTGVEKLAVGVSGILILLTLPQLRLSPSRWRWQVAGLGVASCCVLGLSILSGKYAPAQSAQLLYDANALVSWKSGVPFRLLAGLDDTRLVAVVEMPQGTLTTWRNRGSAISSRLNGIPLAMTVEQPANCPLPSAEVLRAALPLMLREEVNSILMLSDPGGMGAVVASRFPLRHITCHDPLRLSPAGKKLFPNRLDDPRFSGSVVDPHLALLVDDQHYDVVVSAPGHPAMLCHSVEFTQEFYEKAAARLNPAGVFCQRMRIADFGPKALRSVARTMSEVFGEVTAIELSGGEIALLGTSGEGSLVQESLDKRLQRSHIRRLLADLGWDWSTPLNLKLIPDKELRDFSSPAAANTAASDRLAHYLPLEMMRWAPKGAELQEAIGAATIPLAQIATHKDDHEDISQRIKLVEKQHDLMSRYPDQPWAYRKTVRKHLSESPRSTIQRVKGQLDRVLHPEETRRIEYFKALGKALRDIEEPNLAALEAYSEPYDPMISYFLHHEIAPLYAQLGAAGRERELTHRLKAAYFADPRDRSVRNISAAIQLLAAHPEVAGSKADQFDQLNGLVELLLTRWENRGTSTIPASPEMALVDVDRSLDALAKALPVMEALAGEAAMSSEQWKNRADAIERTMSRPLRKYRTTLMPHYRKAKQSEAEEQLAEHESDLLEEASLE